MQLSGDIRPGKPGFEEARWITTEDVNIEHLLDVFTTIGTNSEGTWDACAKFMAQLCWHKPRLVTLGPMIEALSDNHPSKPQCLFYLSQLFSSVGNYVECKQLLSHSLKLWREQGNDFQVTRTLKELSDTNRLLDLGREGIPQAREASEILGQLSETVEQAHSLIFLAFCCTVPNNSTLQRKPDHAPSIFSRRRAKSFWFAKLTVFSAIYLDPRAR